MSGIGEKRGKKKRVPAGPCSQARTAKAYPPLKGGLGSRCALPMQREAGRVKKVKGWALFSMEFLTTCRSFRGDCSARLSSSFCNPLVTNGFLGAGRGKGTFFGGADRFLPCLRINGTRQFSGTARPFSNGLPSVPLTSAVLAALLYRLSGRDRTLKASLSSAA